LGYKRLEFDSDAFGFPVAQVEPPSPLRPAVEALMNEMRSEGIRLAYVSAPSEDAVVCGFWSSLSGGTGYERVVYNGSIPDDEPTTEEQRNGILDGLGRPFTEEWGRLSCQSGLYSRFNRDPRIPKEVFKRIYHQWMINSLEGRVAEAVYAASQGGVMTGMVTVGRRGDEGFIGLVAVDYQSRRQGTGRLLMGEAFRWMRRQGCRRWRVVTQGENQPALLFYESFGARIVERAMIYHLWLDE